MSLDTPLIWLIHRQVLCHEALMTFIDSSLLCHLRRHFEAWRLHIMYSARPVLLLAVLHKAPSDDLLYVMSL